MGRQTVPQVFVNGKHVGGCDGQPSKLSISDDVQSSFKLFTLFGITLLFLGSVLYSDLQMAVENGQLHDLLSKG